MVGEQESEAFLFGKQNVTPKASPLSRSHGRWLTQEVNIPSITRAS